MQFESGEYPLDEVKGNPVTKDVYVHTGVTVERAPGDPSRPVIVQLVKMTGNEATFFVERKATIRDLEIEQLASHGPGEGAGALQMQLRRHDRTMVPSWVSKKACTTTTSTPLPPSLVTIL